MGCMWVDRGLAWAGCCAACGARCAWPTSTAALGRAQMAACVLLSPPPPSLPLSLLVHCTKPQGGRAACRPIRKCSTARDFCARPPVRASLQSDRDVFADELRASVGDLAMELIKQQAVPCDFSFIQLHTSCGCQEGVCTAQPPGRLLQSSNRKFGRHQQYHRPQCSHGGVGAGDGGELTYRCEWCRPCQRCFSGAASVPTPAVSISTTACPLRSCIHTLPACSGLVPVS
jgi:hypothetical protein